MNINKQTIQEFRVDFKQAVKELEEKYGVSMGIGRITFSGEEFSGRLTIVNNTELKDTPTIEGEENENEKQMFQTKALSLGIPFDWYKKTFVSGRKRFTIVDLSLLRPKYCVVLKDENEKTFKATIAQVKSMV